MGGMISAPATALGMPLPPDNIPVVNNEANRKAPEPKPAIDPVPKHGTEAATWNPSQVHIPTPMNGNHFITVSQMIGILQQIQKDKGDIPCVICDDANTYPPVYPNEIMAWVETTGGYDNNGYFVHGKGGPEVCVIAIPN